MVENVNLTEEKKEGAVDCAFENPSVFTPHSRRTTYHVCTKYTKNSLTENN